MKQINTLIHYIKIYFISQRLIKLMKKKSPNTGYTIRVNYWMDSTYQVRCVSFDPTKGISRVIGYYKSQIMYSEE